jgi:hypothetical protein
MVALVEALPLIPPRLSPGEVEAVEVGLSLVPQEAVVEEVVVPLTVPQGQRLSA